MGHGRARTFPVMPKSLGFPDSWLKRGHFRYFPDFQSPRPPPGASGSLREPLGASGSLREPPGASGSLQEASGSLREPPGSLQEPPGSLREASGSLREASGKPRACQARCAGAGRRARRRAPGAGRREVREKSQATAAPPTHPHTHTRKTAILRRRNRECRRHEALVVRQMRVPKNFW